MGHTDRIVALAVTPDGDTLVSAGRDGLVRTWSVGSRAVRRGFRHQGGSITCIRMAMDAAWVAVGGQEQEHGIVRIWDLATGSLRHEWPHPSPRITAALADGDGSWTAAGGDDGRIVLWHPTTGRQLHDLQGYRGGITALAAPSNGIWLASAGGGTALNEPRPIDLWDPATGQICKLEGHRSSIQALAACADGSWLAAADMDGKVILWVPLTGARMASMAAPGPWARVLVADRDGRWLAAAGGSLDSTSGWVAVWDVCDGEARLRWEVRGLPPVTCLVAGVDGMTIATAGGVFAGEGDHVIRLWHMDTGHLRQTLDGHSAPVEALVFSPDGRWLASGAEDRSIRLWSLDSPVRQAPDSPRRTGVTLLVRHPRLGGSQRRANPRMPTVSTPCPCSGSTTERSSPACRATLGGCVPLPGHPMGRASPRPASTASSDSGSSRRMPRPPDGAPRTLGLGSVLGLELRRGLDCVGRGRRTGHLVGCPGWSSSEGARAKGPCRPCPRLRSRPLLAGDRRREEASRDPEVVRLWDPDTGQLLASAKGHRGTIDLLTGSPKGDWLASAGRDGIIRIWHTPTLTLKHELRAHAGSVTALTVTSSGSRVISAGQDGTIRVWAAETGAQAGMLELGPGAVRSICLAGEERECLLAGGDAGVIVALSAIDATLLASLRVDGTVTAVAAEGRRVCAGGPRGPYFLRLDGPV